MSKDGTAAVNAANLQSGTPAGAIGSGSGNPPTDTANNLRLQRMLKDPPLPLLVSMATPNALAFVVQAAVSMVEAYYIGRLGTLSLAAIALIFPGLMLMQMLSGGAMGGAVTSAIARSLGSGQVERAQRLLWHALAIAVSAGLFFFLANEGFGAALLQALGAPADVLAEAMRYANVLFPGCVFIWLTSILSAMFRGMGDMKTPALLMVLGAVIQVPLSGALILGWWGLPSVGILGAAISVVAVAALNAAFMTYRLVVGGAAVPLRWASCKFEAPLFIDILRVGALASLSPIFVVLTIGMLNALMVGFGTAAIAGYGIGARLEFLLIPLVFGLGASMTSLVGVNIGANQVVRAEKIGWTGGGLAAALTGLVGLLVAVMPSLWMKLFTDDTATQIAGAAYLQIVGPAFLFQGLGLSLYFASQGAGTVLWPVLATILRFVVAVGAATIGVNTFGFGLHYVCWCVALGMAIYGVLTAMSLKWGAWRPRVAVISA